MNNHPLRWGLLVLACVFASACQDRREPVKPSVIDLSSAVQVVPGPR